MCGPWYLGEVTSIHRGVVVPQWCTVTVYNTKLSCKTTCSKLALPNPLHVPLYRGAEPYWVPQYNTSENKKRFSETIIFGRGNMGL